MFGKIVLKRLDGYAREPRGLRRTDITPPDISFRTILQLHAIQHGITNVAGGLAGVIFQDRSNFALTAVKAIVVWIRLVRDVNTNGVTDLESSSHPL